LSDIPAATPLPETFVRAQTLGVFPPDLDFATAARRFEVFRRNLRLVEGYAGGSWPGRLQLFRAEESHFDDPEDSFLGWATFAAGGVDLQQLPGNHWAIVQSPSVKIVAAALRSSNTPR
jgi:thioesterase domain-containing protein